MLRMTPLTVEGQPLDVAARWAELMGFVADAARDGLPAHEAMTRTLAGAVAGDEATQPTPATGAQIVVSSADGKGMPLRKLADAPVIAAHDHARGPKPDRKKMAVLGAA